MKLLPSSFLLATLWGVGFFASGHGWAGGVPDSPVAPVPSATAADLAQPGPIALAAPASDSGAGNSLPLSEGVDLAPRDARSQAAVRLNAKPAIDGDLSDPVWRESGITGPFTYQAGTPEFPTVARFGFTADAIYVAWQCYDARPDLILAQQTKRDAGLNTDDNVSLGIDTLNDKRSSYWFAVNPLGTTDLDVPGGSTQNVGWRGDWKAAAKRTETGWQAEMEIPFALLRYPSGQSTFGLVFKRNLERQEQDSSWPLGADDNKTLELEWQGLTPPKIQRKPVFLPYTLLGGGSNIASSAGLDVKYTTDKNVTNLLTVHPDFQTVEDSVQSVDFSYNARFVEDRRPFFTEGGGMFGDSRLIYGRNIEKVDVGLKSFGKVGKLGFGAFDTLAFGGDNNLVGNVGYDLTDTTNTGIAFAHHRGRDGLRNTVMRLAFDKSWPQKVGGMYFSTRAYKSLTGGRRGEDVPSGGNGWMVQSGLDRWAGSGKLEWGVHYNRVRKDFFPALGFLNETDYHGINMYTGYGREYDKGALLNWHANLDFSYYNFEETNKLYRRSLSPSLDLTMRNGLTFGYDYSIGAHVPHRDRVNGYSFGWLTNDIYRRGGFGFRTGRLNGGRYTFYRVNQGWRIGKKWSVSFSHERYKIDYPAALGQENEGATQMIYGLVYDLTPERGLAGRLRFEGGHTGSFLAYRQELRTGKDAYLILGDPNSITSTPFQRIGVKIVNAY